MDALPSIAKEELTEEQHSIYHEYFDDVATRHREETRPPGWSNQEGATLPINASIAHVRLAAQTEQ